jgi:hypothetical protein
MTTLIVMSLMVRLLGLYFASLGVINTMENVLLWIHGQHPKSRYISAARFTLGLIPLVCGILLLTK